MTETTNGNSTAKTVKDLVLEVDAKVDQLHDDVVKMHSALGLGDGQTPIARELDDLKVWKNRATGVVAAALTFMFVLQMWLLVRPFLPGLNP